MGHVTIDFVARDAEHARWRLVLVEEGPWPESELELNLRRLQDRLYTALDAAIDGTLARQYPESDGKLVVIQLTCFNVPEGPVRAFFERFSQGVLQLPDYERALRETTHIADVSFECSCEDIGGQG